MTSNDTESRSGGSVPHAYRQALSWRWAKEMPRPLRGGFLTMLYALSALADTAGRVWFNRDHKPVRISDIANAAGCDEKDARRYLHAAEIAGVVIVEGERRRGRPNLYVIIVSPIPDWAAAADALQSTRRKQRQAPTWTAERTAKFRGLTPELSDPKNGGLTPELQPDPSDKVPGTHPRWSSGDSPPNGSGDSPPNNPGITHEVSHDVADVVALPQPPRAASADKTSPSDTETQQGFARCSVCHTPMVARQGRDTHAHCARSKPA